MSDDLPRFGTLEHCQRCSWWIEEYDGYGHCESPRGQECPPYEGDA